MSQLKDKEAEIVKFPGIASISLSITPVVLSEDLNLIEAIVRVYDENNEQIMRQKARSLFTIAKNLKLFIQNRTNLPINDRRMSVWFATYLGKNGIKLGEEDSYQLIKKASNLLEKLSRVTIEHVETSDLVSVETDVLAKMIVKKSDHLLSEDELYDLLEQNQTEISNIVHRNILYKNSGGVVHKDKIDLEITPSEELFEYKLITSFKNESPSDLTEVILSDIIPYNYKIQEIVCKEGGKYKKELLDNGLKVTWKIVKVPSGGEVKAFYTFEKRIPRTIMIRKGEEIRIVQDYNSLLHEENEDGNLITYFISEVVNLLPVTLDELIIRDLVAYEMRLTENSITDEMEFIDFGQSYGINVQKIFTNVETGTKFLQKYVVDKAPLIWKMDLSVSTEDGPIVATKIIEPLPMKNAYICTLVVSSPKDCILQNDIESGLSIKEFAPKELAPSNQKKMSWEISNKFTISMVLEGTLTRQPNPITIIDAGKEYSAKIDATKYERSSQLLSLPFAHVALYRRQLR